MRILRCSGHPVVALGFAVAFGASVAGCNSSSSSTSTSAAGQSCTRTADCQEGLVCIRDTCYPAATTSVDASADGTTGEGGVAAGGGPEQLGQPCASPSDCASGLSCVPFASAVGGLCDYASFGIVNVDASAAMTCSGECLVAADCCELPAPAQPAIISSPAGYVFNADAGTYVFVPGKTAYLDNCSSILKEGLNGDPSICAQTDGAVLDLFTSEACFYYRTYCACAPNTWACTNNACVYTGPCTVGTNATFGAAATLGDCPTQSRVYRRSSASCTGNDAGAAGSCQAQTCSDSASCNGLMAFGTSRPCQDGDCICHENACYFPCARDLDCAAGYACDPATTLCKAVPQKSCTTNNDCVTVSVAGLPKDAKAICETTTNTCKVPCTNDHDCSLSSGAVPALGPFSGYFCSGGFCAPAIGGGSSCTSNDDCKARPGVAATVNMFCVAPASTSTTLASAITSGAGPDQ